MPSQNTSIYLLGGSFSDSGDWQRKWEVGLLVSKVLTRHTLLQWCPIVVVPDAAPVATPSFPWQGFAFICKIDLWRPSTIYFAGWSCSGQVALSVLFVWSLLAIELLLRLLICSVVFLVDWAAHVSGDEAGQSRIESWWVQWSLGKSRVESWWVQDGVMVSPGWSLGEHNGTVLHASCTLSANAPTTPNSTQQHQTTSNNTRCHHSHSTDDAITLLLVLALLVDNTLQRLLICAYVYFGVECCWVLMLMGVVRCCWMLLAVDGCWWVLLAFIGAGNWWVLMGVVGFSIWFANDRVFCVNIGQVQMEPGTYLLYGRSKGYVLQSNLLCSVHAHCPLM